MMGVTSGLKHRRAIKIEKPRPLKLSTSSSTSEHNMESVLAEMDLVSQSLQSGTWDQRSLYPSVSSLCENLKVFGAQLENVYKDQLDKCYSWLRNGCRDDRLSLAARYRLLEIIELRAMNWKPNQNLISYYQTKLQHIEAEEAAMEEQTELAAYMTSPSALMTSPLMSSQPATLATMTSAQPTAPTPLYTAQHQQAAAAVLAAQQLQYGAYTPTMMAQQQPQTAPTTLLYQQYPQQPTIIPVDQYAQQIPLVPAVPMLSPGEVVRTSGKFTKPTRIAGKNYCKDEVVIRNQDSGKVMGIKGRRVHMIEELSETIISFQRVAPGARERLVQITGPTEENINQAKQLIEDTIRRNASPVREAHSMSSGGSSVFSSSPLNGSNSSIASDEDTNSLTGCKRTTLVHGLSECGSDTACMGDYRYTVAHNNSAIRITGNNLKMVRTAKLVLDEYFNGERNLNNIAQLLAADGGSDTAQPPKLPLSQSSTTPQSSTIPHSKSSSSTTTSHSQSFTTPQSSTIPHSQSSTSLTAPPIPSTTSSSPPLLVKPATPPATPPPSSNGSESEIYSQNTNGGVRGDESPKNGGVGIVRQPLFPSSSKDAVDVAECSTPGSNGSRSRRAAFAKTSEDRSPNGSLLARGYTRQELVDLVDAPMSRQTPQDWASVVQTTPDLLRKGSCHLNVILATMNEQGAGGVSGVKTYLQSNDLLSAHSLAAVTDRWQHRASSEEDKAF